MPILPNSLVYRLSAFFQMRGKGLARISLLLFASLGMLFLLPQKTNFQYQYELNKPWKYRDLIAPFDFPIYKSTQALAAEEAVALKSHLPYFRWKQEVVDQAFLALNASFTEELTADKRDALRRIVKEIFKTGILQASELPQLTEIYVLESGNQRVKKRLEDVWLLQDAYNRFKLQVSNLDIPQEQVTKLYTWGQQYLRPNLQFEEALTEQLKQQALSKIVPTVGLVLAGELIITKGSLVKEDNFQKISSLERELGLVETTSLQKWLSLLGRFVLVLFVLCMLIFYIYFFAKTLYDDLNKLFVILLNLLLTMLVFRFAHQQELPSIYLVPMAILPMITRALFHAGLAFVVLMVVTLLSSLFSGNPSEYIFLQMGTGMAAIFSLISIRKRSQFYLSSGVVFLVYAVGYTAHTLVHKGALTDLIPMYFVYFGVNAVLTLITAPVLFGYERLFGFVSDVTLMELSDTNHPLLRRLSYEAPGTFQHTLQVANLAEAAVYEVGGNALLTRVGALYHDIGKLTNPIYFIENQNAAVNPHDDLPFEESAQLIIGHVLDGIQLAKEAKLPNVLIDFIRTHHGDQRVEYFYQSHLKSFPEVQVDEQKFRYPGPRPFSKETAVLMMADSVEAASRSLKEHSVQSIGNLVESIIDKQMSNGQYTNADITLRDIANIKKLFKKMLNSIYHVRVEYPNARL